jgi:hypothetical protein
MAKVDQQTASVPITAKGYQSMSDAQVGAAAINGSPSTMFPKIPVPPAEVSLPCFCLHQRLFLDITSQPQVGMGISALDERVRHGSSRSQLATSPVKKV